VGVKKSKDLRLTYKSLSGDLRAVVVQVQHVQEDGEDRVEVQVVSDEAPVHVATIVKPNVKRRVKAAR
jgi:hypothetical protein